MNDWVNTLESLRDRAWGGLVAAKGPARQVTLATATEDGWPEARIVVLRDVDPTEATVTIHTDRYSDKITSLRDNPRAAILHWDADATLQTRLTVEIFIQTGLSVAEAWDRVPDPSRQSYGTSPTPGTPIPEPLAYTKPCLQSAFAVLFCRVVALDLVYLGDRHRRAAYSRDDDWAGRWLSP